MIYDYMIILPLITISTELENMMLSKISQKDKYHTISLIYVIKKNRYREQTSGCQRGGGKLGRQKE